MKLESTSKYVSGYVPVVGYLIKTSPNWETYKKSLLRGDIVSIWGRSYRMAKEEE